MKEEKLALYVASWFWLNIAWMFFCTVTIILALQGANAFKEIYTIPFAIGFCLCLVQAAMKKSKLMKE